MPDFTPNRPESVPILPTSNDEALPPKTLAFLVNELIILLCVTMLPHPGATARKLFVCVCQVCSTLVSQV